MYLDGYIKLASAIVNQAIEDYKDYTMTLEELKKKRKKMAKQLIKCSDETFDIIFKKLIKLEIKISKLVRERKDIIRFLRSEWGMTLSGRDNTPIIKKLKGIK